MGHCGTCRRQPVPGAAPATLLQIRRGYRAEWNGLVFSVESESSDWTARVEDFAGKETLYTARRAQASAAQRVAAEYGVIRVLGCESRVNPDRLAGELQWREYWQ